MCRPTLAGHTTFGAIIQPTRLCVGRRSARFGARELTRTIARLLTSSETQPTGYGLVLMLNTNGSSAAIARVRSLLCGSERVPSPVVGGRIGRPRLAWGAK